MTIVSHRRINPFMVEFKLSAPVRGVDSVTLCHGHKHLPMVRVNLPNNVVGDILGDHVGDMPVLEAINDLIELHGLEGF